MDGVRLIARYLGPYRRDFLTAVLCVALETSLELVIPMLMAAVVDDGILAGNLDAVLANGGLMLLFALVSLGLGFLYARFSARAAMGLGARLREAEYAHVQEFSFANLDDFESSSLVTRLTTDVTVIQNALVSGTRPLVRGPVILVMGLLFAWVMSPELALVFFVVTPVLALAMFFVVRRVGPLYRVLQGAMDHLNDALQEDLAAIRVIKAYVREGHVAERFADVNGHLAETATRTFQTAVLNTPIFQGTMYVTCVGILWFGGQMNPDGIVYLTCAASKEEKDQVTIARKLAIKATVDDGALEAYFITLCDFDPFGAGYALYYEHMKDDVTNEPLEEMPHGFFLNVDYRFGDTASEPIIELLDFARLGRRSPSPKGELAKSVRWAVRGLKENSEVVAFADILRKIGPHPWKIGQADKVIEQFRAGKLGLSEAAAKIRVSETEFRMLMQKLDGPQGANVEDAPVPLGDN